MYMSHPEERRLFPLLLFSSIESGRVSDPARPLSECLLIGGLNGRKKGPKEGGKAGRRVVRWIAVT